MRSQNLLCPSALLFFDQHSAASSIARLAFIIFRSVYSILLSSSAHARSAGPFVRDVFLLGVLVYELLEGRELERLNDVPVYDGTLTLNVPALAPWYAKAMDLDPAARYRNASEALDALNACLAVDAGPDVCAADFEGYETDAGPMTLMAKRVISAVPTKMVYESEQNGGRVLVKCWPQLKYDPKYLARNLRLLAFLQKARSLRQSGFNAAPEVLSLIHISEPTRPY